MFLIYRRSKFQMLEYICVRDILVKKLHVKKAIFETHSQASVLSIPSLLNRCIHWLFGAVYYKVTALGTNYTAYISHSGAECTIITGLYP